MPWWIERVNAIAKHYYVADNSLNWKKKLQNSIVKTYQT